MSILGLNRGLAEGQKRAQLDLRGFLPRIVHMLLNYTMRGMRSCWPYQFSSVRVILEPNGAISFPSCSSPSPLPMVP